MVASSSSSTTTSASSSSLDAFYCPEFLQYSEETFRDQPKPKKQRQEEISNTEGLSTAEMRRQIHIQSEQKRRAQIKDGFEDLRNELPACLNKKMSKVALLHKTVQHIQHLKNTQATILQELERLAHENEQLRKFQHDVLQRQALEDMYPGAAATMGNL